MNRVARVARSMMRGSPAVPLLLIPALRQMELLAWSLLVRIGIAALSLERTLAVLDRLPHRRAPTQRNATFPSDRQVHYAGACLGRSLARSQYLRLRGIPHGLIIGVTGGLDAFQAHAWVEPYETAPSGFVELRRIPR